MGKGAFVYEVQAIVLREGQEAPEGWELAAFAECRDEEIKGKDDEISGEDPHGSFYVEFAIRDGLMTGDSGEQLAADEVAA